MMVVLTGRSFAINFETLTINQSLAKAKDENKVVFVFYSATWCLPCEMMKDVVFNDPEVNDYIKAHTIPVMVYFDKNQPSDWVSHFDLKSLPTSMMIGTDGNVISRFEGGMGTQRFKAFLKNEIFIEEKIKLSVSPMDESRYDIEQASAPSLHEKHTNGTDDHTPLVEEGYSFVIQYGAFNTLQRIKLLQKQLLSKLHEETVIYMDPDAKIFRYKLVSKKRYLETEAEAVVIAAKSRGLDCFSKVL
jgi:thioredoxin-related protein